LILLTFELEGTYKILTASLFISFELIGFKFDKNLVSYELNDSFSQMAGN